MIFSALTWLLLLPVYMYRHLISPWMPPCCRFTPSCSEYAVIALKRHGPFYGTFLAAWRILRCNPLCRGGYDPVPGSENISTVPSDEKK